MYYNTSMSKNKKKKQPLGTGRKIILMLCLIVFCGSAAYIGLYYKEAHQVQVDFAQIEGLGLEDLYAKNQDTIGWLKVPDTRINYPVMQTKDDPEFYLHRNFDKEESASGTPFLAADCNLGDSQGKGATWNWLIYGHNMKSGTMFHDLLEFESQEFWESHPTFTLDIIRGVEVESHDVEIFAAVRSRIFLKDESGFRYYQYTNYTDQQTFNDFVSGVQKQSCISTGITPEFGDQLVTLSTCAYHTEEGRFYVVGILR